MLAGLIARYDALEFQLKLDVIGRGFSEGILRCDALATPYSVVPYLYISLSKSEFPDAGWVETAAAVFLYDPVSDSLRNIWSLSSSSVEDWLITVRLVGFRVFVTSDFQWKVQFDGVEVSLNGVLQSVDPIPVTEYTSSYLAPTGLPLLGLSPQIRSHSLVDIPPNGTAAERTAVAFGGWRFKVGGVAVEPPVAIYAGSSWTPDEFPCSDCVPEFTTPTGSTTWSASAPSRSWGTVEYFSGQQGDCWWDGNKGNTRSLSTSLFLLPNLPRAFLTLTGEPVSALVKRLTLPFAALKTEYLSERSEWVAGRYETVCSDSHATTDILYEASPETVTRLTAQSLPPDTIYTPVVIESSCEQNALVRISTDCTGIEPIPRPPAYRAFAKRFFPFCSEAPSYLEPNLTDVLSQSLARYINTVANPHWSHFLWWADWSLGVPLQPVPYLDYWLPLQQQWLGDSNLPDSERTRQRNQCLLEPLTVSPYLDWIADTLVGYPTLWAGISRFEVIDLPHISSIILDADSQSRWFVTGGTILFNPTNITVLPTQNVTTLEFELADWDTKPYLYPAIADRVRISITGVYQSIRVYLVNPQGDTVELQPDPNDDTLYAYRTTGDTIYAGSWAHDYNALLSTYREDPYDLRADGVSSATMGDPARRTLYQLMGAKSAQRIRIVVEQSAPTSYLLDYPTFHRVGAPTKAYPDTAHTQFVIDGDHLWRHGGLQFQTNSPIPLLRPPHTAPTVYDALCLRNLLYRAQPYQADLTTTANLYYDDAEWSGSYNDLRLHTRALVYPLRERAETPLTMLINAWREVPPIACLPRRRRNLFTLAEDGDWGQWSYLLAPTLRYYAANDTPIHLYRVEYDGNGNETSRTQITNSLEQFQRYAISAHALALDNNEVMYNWSGVLIDTPRYYLHRAGTDYARVTPFHGYSAILPLPQTATGSGVLECDTRRQWLHYAQGTTLRTRHLATYDLLLTADIQPCEWLSYDSRLGALVAVFRVDANTRTVGVSYSAGAEWQGVITMTAEHLIVECISPHGIWVAIYRTGSGTILRAQSYDAGATWQTGLTVQLDGTDAINITPESMSYDARTQSLVMSYARDDDSRAIAVSHDYGETWTTVLP